MPERRRNTKQCKGGSSLRSALSELRTAYGNADALVRSYDRAAERSILFRGLAWLIERAYPARAFLELAADLDRDIAAHGLQQACARVVERFIPRRETTIPAEAIPMLHAGGTILYGNHPSLVTPFLVGSCVERDDLRYVSTSYVCRLIPELGTRAYPVEVILDRKLTEYRRGGVMRVLAHSLVSRLHPLPDRAMQRERNARSLAEATEHVRRGGALIICPDGGGVRSREWYEGIGRIVGNLHASGHANDVHVLPFWEGNSTNRRIYCQLRRSPWARLRYRVIARRPVLLRFGQPLSVAEVVTSQQTAAQTVGFLRRYYESQCIPAVELE